MPSIESKTILDKYKGCITGAAVGDALGAPVEFLSPSEIKRQYGVVNKMFGGGVLNWKVGQTTDDTDLTLAIVDSLIENQSYVPKDIADRMLLWFEGGPKDVGPTTAASLTLYAQGNSFWESGKIAIKLGKAGPGNGSLMRTHPVGLYLHGFPDEIDRVAAEISAITHAHEDSMLACQMASHLVALLASGYEKNDAIGILKEKYPSSTKAGYKLRHALDGAIQYGGNYAYVFDTLTVALTSFVKAKSFQEAVINAIHEGWDTDTQATVAGAFAGAFWGNDNIPKEWKVALNPIGSNKLEEKSEKLYYLNKRLLNGRYFRS